MSEVVSYVSIMYLASAMFKNLHPPMSKLRRKNEVAETNSEPKYFWFWELFGAMFPILVWILANESTQQSVSNVYCAFESES